MKELFLSPPVAFVVYLVLVGILYGLGRLLAGATKESSIKTSTYSSGEAPPLHLVGPGYRPFFVVALFFAILHLGILVLGSSTMNAIALVYLVGIMIALLALIIG